MSKEVLQEAVIKIGTMGLEACRASLQSVEKLAQSVSARVGAFQQKLAPLTNSAAAGFATLTASLTAFVAAADPVRFTIFKQQLLILAQEIGKIFIPVLAFANRQLTALIKWFKDLTPETKALVRQITLLGGVMLGAVAAVGVGLAVFAKIAAVFAVVGVKLVALVAVLAAAGVALAAFAGKGDVLKGLRVIWDGIVDAATRAWRFIGPILQTLYERFTEIAQRVRERVSPAFERIGAAFQRAWAALQPVFSALLGQIDRIAGVAGDYLGDAAETGFGKLADLVAFVAEKVADLVNAVGPYLSAGIMAAGQAFDEWSVRAVNGINAVIDKVNLLIDLLNHLPFINIEHYGKLSGPDLNRSKRPQYTATVKGAGEKEMGPMRAPSKVEFMGLEEVNRRAQQAINGAMDPAKIAEQNLKESQRNNKLQEEGNSHLKDLRDTIRKRPTVAQYG